jgi:hypothetical protein
MQGGGRPFKGTASWTRTGWVGAWLHARDRAWHARAAHARVTVGRSSNRQRQRAPCEATRRKLYRGAAVRATLAKGEETRWPRSGEKGCAPVYGTVGLNGTREARRQARRRTRAGGIARLVAEPLAPGIGGGTTMVGSRRCLRRAQRREATAQRMRGQGS